MQLTNVISYKVIYFQQSLASILSIVNQEHLSLNKISSNSFMTGENHSHVRQINPLFCE